MYISPLVGVSLASPLPLAMSSHCQMALDKLIFLSLQFFGLHLHHVPPILSCFLFDTLLAYTLSGPASPSLTWTSLLSLLALLPLWLFYPEHYSNNSYRHLNNNSGNYTITSIVQLGRFQKGHNVLIPANEGQSWNDNPGLMDPTVHALLCSSCFLCSETFSGSHCLKDQVQDLLSRPSRPSKV